MTQYDSRWVDYCTSENRRIEREWARNLKEEQVPQSLSEAAWRAERETDDQ